MRDRLQTPRFPRWLMVVIAAVVIAVLAGGLWFYRDLNQGARKTAQDQLVSIAELKVDQIVQWRAERLADAGVISGTPFASELVLRWLETGQPADKEQILTWLQTIQDQYHYSGVRLVDATGKSLLAVGGDDGALSPIGVSGVLEALAGGKPLLTDLHFAVDQIIQIDAIAPLFAPTGGSTQPLGAVVLHVDAGDFLYPLIQSWPTPTSSAETLLVRRVAGRVLYLNELRFQSGTALTLNYPLSESDLSAVMAVEGKQGLVESRDYRGVKVLADLQPIPDSPWFIIAKIDVSEAFSGTTLRLGLVFGLICLFLVAAIGGSLLVWQWGLKRRYRDAYDAEATRRGLLERFEHVVRQAGDIILLADEGLRIVEANDQAVQTYGYSSEEFLDLRIPDLMPLDRLTGFEARMADAEDGSGSVHESTHRRRDGSVFPAEVSDRKILLDGKTYYQAVVRDITERKQTEDALHRQVAFGELVEGLLSRVAGASAAEIDGHIAATLQPIADFIGVDSAIVFQSADDQMTWGARYGWAAPGIRSVFERLKNIPMGSLPWVENELLAGKTVLLRSSDDLPPEADDLRQLWEGQSLRSALLAPLRGRGALVRGCLALFSVSDELLWKHQDVRQVEQVGEAIANALERKHAEEALRQSEEQLRESQKMEAVGQLAGGIAHDFNNLLTAILGYSQLLLASEELPDPARTDLEEIEHAAERAGALTKQILAFSRRQALRPDVVSLNQVLSGVESLLRRTLGENIDLISLPHPDLGHAEIDVHQFEQVLMNLALNARDAMPSGGRLTLETANAGLDKEYCRTHLEVTPGSYVMLAVSDTGIGMDEATLGHVFEPFFTTKAPGEGTGLGLATAYGIVKQSRGHIFVYSQLGIGTTFKIYLPRAEAHEAAEVVVLPEHIPTSGSEIVMVVEDESSLRSLIERVLAGAGYGVISFGSGDEALVALEQGHVDVDLLLTDVVLPGALQGNDLARTVFASRPDLPVLYMSGYTRNAIVHAGRLDEGVNFLEKPFTPEALARMVREVLDQGRSSG